jgi:hypothetical protein
MLIIVAWRRPQLRHVPGIVGGQALAMAANLRNHGRWMDEVKW